MKKISILFLFSSLLTLVYADHLRGGYPGCITEKLYNQYIEAAIKNDSRALLYLKKNGCVITKSNIPISILDLDWGTAKVRAYVGDTAIVLWTNVENLVRK